MPRLMSVTLTEQAVVERRKTVTRRLGWRMLKVGDELVLCRKVMGRRRADGTVEPLVRLARVRVVDVRRECLQEIEDDDVAREGFTPADLADYEGSGQPGSPGDLGTRFMAFFTKHMRCQPDTTVTRIEWRYLDGEGA